MQIYTRGERDANEGMIPSVERFFSHPSALHSPRARLISSVLDGTLEALSSFALRRNIRNTFGNKYYFGDARVPGLYGRSK